MKHLIVAIIALAPMAAFATDCSEGSCWPSTYPVEQGAPRLCREGQTERFIETDPTSGRNVYVLRTCHNGAFVQSPAPVIHSCREGARERFIETDATSGNNVYVTRTCHNGAWY
jgi:hypothetical protein